MWDASIPLYTVLAVVLLQTSLHGCVLMKTVIESDATDFSTYRREIQYDGRNEAITSHLCLCNVLHEMAIMPACWGYKG